MELVSENGGVPRTRELAARGIRGSVEQQRFSSRSPRWSPSSEHPATRGHRAATKRSPRPRRSSCATRPRSRAPAAAPAARKHVRGPGKPGINRADEAAGREAAARIDALLDARTPRADDLRLALARDRGAPPPSAAGRQAAALREVPARCALSAVRRGGHDRRHELLRQAPARRLERSLAPSESRRRARELRGDRLHPGARAPSRRRAHGTTCQCEGATRRSRRVNCARLPPPHGEAAARAASTAKIST